MDIKSLRIVLFLLAAMVLAFVLQQSVHTQQDGAKFRLLFTADLANYLKPCG